MNTPKDLQIFLRALESINELERVKYEVDPYLEVADIIDNECKNAGSGKALLFEKVKGSSVPLVANAFGSMTRMALALGVKDLDVLANKLKRELTRHPGISSDKALEKIVKSVKESTFPQVLSEGHNYRNDSRLTDLPALHSWPGDGGKYLTLAQLFSTDPDSQHQNCGMYRVQIVDNQTALLRCHPGSGGDRHIKAWHKQGKPMPVAITLGGPPALTWAAGVSLPDEIEELEFVSWLTGKSFQLISCSNSELKVPASAEIVIEGLIYPDNEMLEGPFGNHTGYYSEATSAPVINIQSVVARNDPVYPCTVVGPPPMENSYLAATSLKVMLPLLKHDHPWVEDVHVPAEGAYHKAAFVAVSNDGMTINEVAECLWTSRILKNSRLIVLLDQDTDLSSTSEIFWRVVNAKEWGQTIYCENNKLLIDARDNKDLNRITKSGKGVN